jgi:hypothetical protein
MEKHDTFSPVRVNEHLAYSVLFLTSVFLPGWRLKLAETPLMPDCGRPTLFAFRFNPFGIQL